MEKKMGMGFGIMFLRDGKILLGKRHEDPEKASSLMHGEGTWTMPGGKLHFGEEFRDACVREVAEETGIKIDKEKLKLISVSNDIVTDAHFVTLGFLIEDFSDEARVMEPDEITEWQWFALDKLPERVFPPSQKVLNNYNSKKIFSE